MSYLNATSRAVLRKALRKWLSDTCTITAEVVTKDTYGGQSRATQVVAASVPCRLIGSMEANEAALVGSQESMKDTYRLIVPAATGLAVDQQVIVNTITYNVVSILSARTDELDEQAIVTRQR